MQPSAFHDAERVDETQRRLAAMLGRTTDVVVMRWRRRAVDPTSPDAVAADVLACHRHMLVDAALGALWPAATAALDIPGDTSRGRGLPLVGDDDVALDIASTRLTELLDERLERLGVDRGQAEARDVDWPRPQHLVEALTTALAALPLERAAAAAFLCDAAPGLVVAMRDARRPVASSHDARCAVATAGDAGVRAEREKTRLLRLHDALGDGPPQASGPAARQAPAPAAATGSAAAVGLKLPGAFDTVYGEVLRDAQIDDELRGLLARLRPALQRQVRREALAAADETHPMWRFVDTLAHRQVHAAATDRRRLLGLGRNLVDILAREPGGEGGVGVEPPFSWALHRLDVGAEQLLAATLAASRGPIAALERMLAEAAVVDTIPAALPAEPDPTVSAPAPDAPAGLGWMGDASWHAASRVRSALFRTGAAWRMRLHGRWRPLQALRRHGPEGIWLLREVPSAKLWALRPAAVDALVYAGLAYPLRQRSLLRRARWRLAHGGV